MFILAYFAFWQKALGPFAAAMLVMAIFVGFNPVLYVQYFIWLIPLLLLTASEWMNKTAESDVTQSSIGSDQTKIASV